MVFLNINFNFLVHLAKLFHNFSVPAANTPDGLPGALRASPHCTERISVTTNATAHAHQHQHKRIPLSWSRFCRAHPVD